jgi:L-asparaginase
MGDLLIVTTGGTIGSLPYDDPIHPPAYSTFSNDDPVLRALSRPDFGLKDTRTISLPPKDSKDFTDADMAALVAMVGEAPEALILITFGTDRILQAAEILDQKKLPKTIILTGAMVPLMNEGSDGSGNLAFALKKLNELTHGVYIVLCDYAGTAWEPRLYEGPFDAYQKHHEKDARYSRIVKR